MRVKREDLVNETLVRRFEGWAVYQGERDGRFYVIQDESGLASLLSDEDLESVELVTVLEFATEAERATYLERRGWLKVGKGADG